MSLTLDPQNLTQIVDALSVGMIVVNGELEVRLWNRWMEDHSGLQSADIVGKQLHEIFPDTEFSALRRKVRQVLTLGNAAFFDARVDGYLFPFPNEQQLARRFRYMQQDCVLVPLHRTEDESDLVCVTIYDSTHVVTAELMLEESHLDLERRSRRDSLTGLFNRGHILELLETEIKRARRYHSKLSVSLMDVDRFKSINDRFGHLTGDRVLEAVGESLLSCLRETDSVGRYGGEEFLVIMPNTDLERAVEVAERLRVSISSLALTYDGESLEVTGSFGVAQSRKPHELDTLLLGTDQALYRAKQAGRDRIEVDLTDDSTSP